MRPPAIAGDSKLSRMVMPEHILPCQMEGRAPATGARLLLITVLHDAVDRLREARQRKLSTVTTLQVEAWFADGDRSWPCSFLALCDTLGLDAGLIRARLGVSTTPVHIPVRRCLCGKPRHKGQCVARRLHRANSQYRAKLRAKARREKAA